MGLVEHAKQELQLAGYYKESGSLDEIVANSIVDMLVVFVSVGHSGCSAELTLETFNRLANWKLLTPITDDPDEWEDRTKMSGSPWWQNKRQSSAFSQDGGKTWWDVDDPERTIHASETH